MFFVFLESSAKPNQNIKQIFMCQIFLAMHIRVNFFLFLESSAKANQNIKQIFLDLITLVKKKQGGNISIDSKGELIICSVD
jgi:hypothetical protein